MATPVGHYLVALAITQGLAGSTKERKQGVVLAAASLLPDLDLVAGLYVGDFWTYHRAASHSVTAALAFGLVALLALLLFRARRPVYAATTLFLVYFSHLALDSMMLDSSSKGGIALLWPWLDTRFQTPIPLVPAGRYQLSEVLSLANAAVVLWEAVVFVPLAALVVTLRQGDAPWLRAFTWPRKTAWIFASWFAVAVLATLALG